MCVAITQRSNDIAVRCEQKTVNEHGLCYYHQKMFEGKITPFFEDASVKTEAGTKIYTKGRKSN